MVEFFPEKKQIPTVHEVHSQDLREAKTSGRNSQCRGLGWEANEFIGVTWGKCGQVTSGYRKRGDLLGMG